MLRALVRQTLPWPKLACVTNVGAHGSRTRVSETMCSLWGVVICHLAIAFLPSLVL